jgi:hypothetical protein
MTPFKMSAFLFAVGGLVCTIVTAQPVIKMKFDDPEQEPPKCLVTNNIALSTPYPGIQIKAWAMVNRKQMGVYLTGTARRCSSEIRNICLIIYPKGTVVDPKSGCAIILKNEVSLPDSFASVSATAHWILGAILAALSRTPILKLSVNGAHCERLHEETFNRKG